MDREDKRIRNSSRPGKEPTVYADLCAEVGHEHCKGIERTVEGHEGKSVFCICWCPRFSESEPN